VQPELLRDGRLIEVMPNWHFSIFHLWVVHLGNRYITRPVRVFKEFAAQMAPDTLSNASDLRRDFGRVLALRIAVNAGACFGAL